MNWTARAKAAFLQKCPERTDKTDERGVLTVSSVPSGRVYEFPQGVSSVLAVPTQGLCEKTQFPDAGVSSVSSVGVVALFENCIPADELIEAAMRACDHWNDSAAAREQMRRECLDTPIHLRAELRDHFIKAYPRANQ